jgi:hypothetical protein
MDNIKPIESIEPKPKHAGGRPKKSYNKMGLSLKKRLNILKQISIDPDAKESEKVAALREMNQQLGEQEAKTNSADYLIVKFVEDIDTRGTLKEFVIKNLQDIKAIIKELDKELNNIPIPITTPNDTTITPPSSNKPILEPIIEIEPLFDEQNISPETPDPFSDSDLDLDLN